MWSRVQRSAFSEFLPLIIAMCLAALVAMMGCGPSGDDNNNNGTGGLDGGINTQRDGSVWTWPDGQVGPSDAEVEPNWDAYFATDPPPAYCGPDGGTPPEYPGGTPDCPDDKNREGCPCTHAGDTAACWPGLRVDRNRGICHDGTTTCEYFNEFMGRWGPCEGYQLPDPNATTGAAACNCFSAGQWEIDNLSPCFVTYNGDQVYAVSTFMNGADASCPTNLSQTPPPQPEPGQDFSTNRLTVDCAGHYELCFVLRAGDENDPQPTDCEVARSCVQVWYDTPDVTMELPALPSWTSSDYTCAGQFADSGGYAEMTVEGLSIECDAVDDGNGQPYVFHRIGYCPTECNSDPTLPGCDNCGNGGSGSF